MLDMRKKEDREKIRNNLGELPFKEYVEITSVEYKQMLQLLDLADERDHLAKKCEILGKAYRDLENKLLEEIEKREIDNRKNDVSD